MNLPIAEGELVAGKYRVEHVLGKGGMGVIIAATHIHLSQRVAIKFLLADDRPDAVARFLREARAAGRLKGDHVVRVFDVGQLDGGQPYMVMECLEGWDLSTILKSRERFSVAEAIDFVLQACEAMAEAHAAGIVHRDLKPSNLFLVEAADGSARVKVLDFGISKDFSSGEAGLTQTEEMIGSPLYMSPEQMKSSRSVDTRTDVWSLGAILYRFLTGYPPFTADTLTELIFKVTTDAPLPPNQFRPDLEPQIAEAILRALTKDRTQRFQSVAELAFAIAPYGPPGSDASAARVERLLGERKASMPSVPEARASSADAEEETRPSGPSSPPPGNGPEVVTGSGQRTRTVTVTTVPVGSQSAMRGKSAWVTGGMIAAAVAAAIGAVVALRRPAPAEETGSSRVEASAGPQPGLAFAGDPLPPVQAANPSAMLVPVAPAPTVTPAHAAPSAAPGPAVPPVAPKRPRPTSPPAAPSKPPEPTSKPKAPNNPLDVDLQ